MPKTKNNLKSLKVKAEKELLRAQDPKDLDIVFKKYLGKKGELTRILRSLKNLPKAKRVKVGKEANKLKNFLSIRFSEAISVLKEKAQKEGKVNEWLDITAPGKKAVLGHLHPLTLVRRKAEEIFGNMGFTVVEGPE